MTMADCVRFYSRLILFLTPSATLPCVDPPQPSVACPDERTWPQAATSGSGCASCVRRNIFQEKSQALCIAPGRIGPTQGPLDFYIAETFNLKELKVSLRIINIQFLMPKREASIQQFRKIKHSSL